MGSNWAVAQGLIAGEAIELGAMSQLPAFAFDNFAQQVTQSFKDNIDDTQHRKISPATCDTWPAVRFSEAFKDPTADLNLAPQGNSGDQCSHDNHQALSYLRHFALYDREYQQPGSIWQETSRSESNKTE